MLKNKQTQKHSSSKSRNKRIMTIYSSCANIHQTSHAPSIVVKSKKTAKPTAHQTSISHHASVHLPSQSNTNILRKSNKSSKQLGKSRKHKSKGGKQSQYQQSQPQYERIPMSSLYSNTNSQIQFSHDATKPDTVRPGLNHKLKRPLSIQISQSSRVYESDNDLLREPPVVGKNRKRRVDAAIKIQKVWRGYMTRKLLSKYIMQEQQKLIKQIQQIRAEHKHRQRSMFTEYSGEQGQGQLSERIRSLGSSYFPSSKKPSALDMESSIMEMQPSVVIPSQIDLDFNEQACVSISFNKSSPRFVQSNNTNPNTKYHLGSQNVRTQISQQHQKQQEYQNIREQTSNLTSLHLSRLKQSQKQKWQQMAELLSSHLSHPHTSSTHAFMLSILSLSRKNCEQLQEQCSGFEYNHQNHNVSPDIITPETDTNRKEEQPWKKKKDFTQSQQNHLKNTTPTPIPVQVPTLEHIREERNGSILQRTQHMKEHLLKNLTIHDDHVTQLMEFRELALQQKEDLQISALEKKYKDGLITGEEYTACVKDLKMVLDEERVRVEKSKELIEIGYRAQMQLMRQTMKDAKRLGVKIAMCRSMGSKSGKWAFDGRMVDQLQGYIRRKKQGVVDATKINTNTNSKTQQKIIESNQGQIKNESQKQQIDDLPVQLPQQSLSQSDSVTFSYQDEPHSGVYKKHMPFSIDISQLSKNMNQLDQQKCQLPLQIRIDERIPIIISRKLNEENQDNLIEQTPVGELRKQRYELNYEESDEEIILYKQSGDRELHQIVNSIFNRCIWEGVEELSQFPIQGESSDTTLKRVESGVLMEFVNLVESMLPSFTEIYPKLNQKMYPTPSQLLLSMREEEYDGQEYVQIGQFQYLISQTICMESIREFLKRRKQEIDLQIKNHLLHIKEAQRIIIEEGYRYFTPSFIDALQNKERGKRDRECQNIQLMHELLKIQLHVVLDCWNEQIIKLREDRRVYHIGLNLWEYSLQERKSPQIGDVTQYNCLIAVSKHNVLSTLGEEATNDKLMKENAEWICNDSQWNNFINEALDYGVDLVRVIELELWIQLIRDIQDINQREIEGDHGDEHGDQQEQEQEHEDNQNQIIQQPIQESEEKPIQQESILSQSIGERVGPFQFDPISSEEDISDDSFYN